MPYNTFVVVPIDKTNGNIVFGCQRHYAQVSINELDLNNVNNLTSTYMKETAGKDWTR